MLIAFSEAPTVAADDTGSVSDAVARAIRVVRDSGLPHRTDAMFTMIERSKVHERHMEQEQSCS
jgi:uncharacterized protein YqgV (UPF0045/DUF77 family)